MNLHRVKSLILHNLAALSSRNEIETFAFQLDIDSENLRGETKEQLARSFIDEATRKGYLKELSNLGREGRPDLEWPNDDDIPNIEQQIREGSEELISELWKEIASLRKQLFDLQEKHMTLHEEIKQLKEQKALEKQIFVKKDVYYLSSPPDNRPAGPYCTRCWDVERLLVYLANTIPYQCPNCKNTYPHPDHNMGSIY